MVDSTDLAQVLHEAKDIAQSVSQKLSSAHLLLALFTVDNPAQVLLRERGVDEDRLLELMTGSPTEEEHLVRDLCQRARVIAQQCDSREADCLHLLIAFARVRCAANDLLSQAGVDLISLRTTALSYFTSGRMPRKLQASRTPAPQALGTRYPLGRPLGAPPTPLPTSHSAVALSLPRTPSRASMPAISPRDLIDEDEGHDEAPAAPPVARAIPVPPPPASTPAPRAPAPTPAPAPLPMAKPGSLALEAKAFPLLTSLGRNLSVLALDGKLDPVVGRAKEIEEVIDILGKRRTNNPCLLGEAGVGKTAVVEGVAQQLVTLRGTLGSKVLIELDMASLVAGTQLRGSFSEKLNALKDEVKKADGRVVVFIDEIHTLVGAGSTGEGPQDAANELKTAMARGEFPCIGATTHDEFRKFITTDPALERRFTPVVVNEPSVPQTVEILKGVIGRYEEHHGLQYAPEALEAAASLASRYVTDRFMPDKAISVVDLAGSRSRREGKELVEASDVA
ncbi:MAG TPA: AAA family ATPase, partial [Myxococcaceae bacterium]|nr:AAA family ATPase [Myxococcaceae bacterium]